MQDWERESNSNEKHNESAKESLLSGTNRFSQKPSNEYIEKVDKITKWEHFDFKPKLFFKFLLLWIIFLIFGPFSSLIFCWKKHWITFAKNANILGGKEGIVNNILWCCRWYAILITVLPVTESRYSNLSINLYLALTTDISVGILYASYFSSFRYSEIKRFMEEPGYKMGKGSILNQLHELIQTKDDSMFEPEAIAINFPEIDLNMFCFTIPAAEKDKLPPSLINKEYLRCLEFDEDIMDCITLDGIAVSKQLLDDIRESFKRLEIGFHIEKAVTRLIVSIRILYPLGLQIYQDIKEVQKDQRFNWEEFFSPKDIMALAAYFCFLVILCYFYFIYDVLLLGLGFQYKRLKLMRAITKLIEKRTKSGIHVSMLIPQNITNWVNLRILLANSYKQIQTIVQINISFMLLFLVMVMSFIIANSLGNLPFPKFLKDATFQIITATYLLLMISMTIIGMLIGTQINDYFRKHQNILQNRLDIAKNLADFHSKYEYQLRNLHEKLSESRENKFSQELAELKQFLKDDDDSSERYKRHLRRVIKVLKHSIERLEWEEIERPNKILSIKTNLNSLLTIGSTLTILGVGNLKLILEYASGRPIDNQLLHAEL